jgi:translation initiation factor 1
MRNGLSKSLSNSQVEGQVDILCDLFYTIPNPTSKLELAMPNNKTVWSSEQGDLRKKNQNTANIKSLPTQQQTVTLHRESSGRRGKAVTLVKNLVLSAEGLKALGKKLKQECGTGGTIKDGLIEIQGEQREKIAGVLQKLGYKVKIAGG